jgi:serine/threonine protein kinase/Tol biopolymer transport system component
MIDSTLSHYEITAELGRGGMGIVYKARDTKLDRTVAIKVLPSAALATQDDRERFYREAKAAAALNHPHIAQVYEIDEAVPSNAPHGTQPSPFIAMEFIDGRPLNEEIKERPLKLEKAVALAIQIAQALEAAHEKHIVHRDIKSANVMLTVKGEAKVLDFGLAKTTHSTMLTRMGSTLGTVAYMSPEQARGEEVDHRSDLWALGVVLYEMVAGTNPFGGDYEQAVVYSILNEAPEPLTAVRTGVPMQLEWIVNKCLAKQASDRYQSAKDLIVDLRQAGVASASGLSRATTMTSASGLQAAPPATNARSTPWLMVAAALLVGLALASAWFIVRSPAPETRPMTRVSVALPDITSARFSQLSSTGEYLAFSGSSRSGSAGIFTRDMRTGQIRALRGTENATLREFGFSPDGSRIAYTLNANDGVFMVEVPNGIPVEMASPGRYAFWLDNETVAMTDDRAGGGDSYLIDTETFEKTRIEIDDPKLVPPYGNILKTVVPGTDRAFGIQLIRGAGGGTNATDPVNIFTLDLSSGQLDIIARNASNVVAVTDDVVAYQIGSDTGELVIRAFNPATGSLEGSTVNLSALGVLESWGDYSFTSDGDLLYVGAAQQYLFQRLFLFNLEERTARPLPVLLPEPLSVRRPDFSPDGNLVAFNDSENGNAYALDIRTGRQTQFTFNGAANQPVFDPSGDALYYSQFDTTSQSLTPFRVPLDNVAGARSLPDGLRFVAFSNDGRLEAGLLPAPEDTVFAVRNRSTGATVRLDSSRGGPWFPDFSPDGRYLVYMADLEWESALIVRSTDGQQTIPIPGLTGFSPRFSPDGQWLYFARRAGVFRIPIRLTPTFAVAGTEEQIIVSSQSDFFDLSPDGTLLVVSAATADFVIEGTIADVELIWLQHFTEFIRDELVR